MRIEKHDLNSLRKIIRKLQEENIRLKKELKKANLSYDEDLFNDCDFNEDEYDLDQSGRIIEKQITRDLAKDFYRMFWVRPDVYARRSSKGDYFPQCFNSFNENVCPRKQGIKMQCGKCKERQFKRIDSYVLANHLLGAKEDGSDVIGGYVLLENNKCKFIVFDFDDHGDEAKKEENGILNEDLKQEVNVIRNLCVKSGFAPLVERSRSGSGIHIWLFFDKEINAGLARDFGFTILDKCLEQMNLKSIQYYDRIYPSQDKSDSLGSLIALPLQGKALKKGNSAFIDENFNAYEDQWKALFSTSKISEKEIRNFILNAKIEETNGAGLIFGFDNEKRKKPWEKEVKFNKENVIEKIYITKANGIYVDAINLLPELQNQIRNLAVFSNPIYYKNLHMGLSNYKNDSAIYMGEDKDGYIVLPRGLNEKLFEKIEEAKIDYEIKDKRSIGRPIRVKFKGELTSEQSEAIPKLLSYDNGILDATMAFGKTVVSAYLISKKKISTLIVVTSTNMLNQWKDELHTFLDIDELLPKYKTEKGRIKQRKDLVGLIGGGKDTSTGIIDVAMDASLVNRDDLDELLDKYGMIIYDESQHASNNTAIKIFKAASCKYVYGLTGTQKRSDKLEKIALMMIGPIRHSYTARQRALKQGIKHYIYPRFTNVVDIYNKDKSINESYVRIRSSITRNEMIVNDVKKAVSNNRSPLVLTKFKKHAKGLYELLKNAADEVYLIYGDNTANQNKKIFEKLRKNDKTKSLIIVATGQMVGEGFNMPRLDTLMLALPVSTDSGRLEQYMGRINRDYPGKEEVIVYDYIDWNIKVFNNMYYKRLKVYTKDAYEVRNDLSLKQETNHIFDSNSYQEVFERDLLEANKGTVISCQNLMISKVTRFLNIIKERQEAGVKATIITSTIDGNLFIDEEAQLECVSLLKKEGINIIEKEDHFENYAVVDDEIVWHGNISLLGKEDYNARAIRIKDKKAAEELLNT